MGIFFHHRFVSRLDRTELAQGAGECPTEHARRIIVMAGTLSNQKVKPGGRPQVAAFNWHARDGCLYYTKKRDELFAFTPSGAFAISALAKDGKETRIVVSHERPATVLHDDEDCIVDGLLQVPCTMRGWFASRKDLILSLCAAAASIEPEIDTRSLRSALSQLGKKVDTFALEVKEGCACQGRCPVAA